MDPESVERERLIRSEVEPTLLPQVVLWPAERPRFTVTVQLREIGDHFECVGLAVRSIAHGAFVKSSTMRSLPVGAIIDAALKAALADELGRERVALTQPRDGEPTLAERGEGFQARADRIEAHLARATGHGTGKRYAPGHLEMVAEIHQAARRRGDHPTQAVADAFGITPSAAANQVARARQLGFFDSEREQRQ